VSCYQFNQNPNGAERRGGAPEEHARDTEEQIQEPREAKPRPESSNRDRKVEPKYKKGSKKLHFQRKVSFDSQIAHDRDHGAEKDHQNNQKEGLGRTQARDFFHLTLPRPQSYDLKATI